MTECMAKPIQYCKVITLQKINIFFKKREKENAFPSKIPGGCCA